MFRAPTEKHPSQIIATFGDTIPKTSETVVLVGKSPTKEAEKSGIAEKELQYSSIWMCMNNVRYATSYQIHSTLLLIPSYTSYIPFPKRHQNHCTFQVFWSQQKNRPKPCQIRPDVVDRRPREALEEDGPLEVQAYQGSGPVETVPPGISTGKVCEIP